jgi:hypothetical protein
LINAAAGPLDSRSAGKGLLNLKELLLHVSRASCFRTLADSTGHSGFGNLVDQLCAVTSLLLILKEMLVCA